MTTRYQPRPQHNFGLGEEDSVGAQSLTPFEHMASDELHHRMMEEFLDLLEIMQDELQEWKSIPDQPLVALPPSANYIHALTLPSSSFRPSLGAASSSSTVALREASPRSGTKRKCGSATQSIPASTAWKSNASKFTDKVKAEQRPEREDESKTTKRPRTC